jgi:hypothetical protein
MRTNAEFVSRVYNGLKATTKDGRVSQRYILSIGQDKVHFLVSQKLDELTLSRERGIVTEIPCFEMEDVPVLSCEVLEFRDCRTVKKSVLKLPRGIYGKVGSGISQITSIDGGKLFRGVTPQKYRNLEKLRYKGPKVNYYAIVDDNIYLLNAEAEAINISMILLEKYNVRDVSSCCDDAEKCKSNWEYEFVCPDRFFDLVVRDTIAEVANFLRTSQEDSNPNLDVNSKGKTTA